MEPIKLANVAVANAKSRRLRELVRAPEILVMPGAYDVLSALFEQMGSKQSAPAAYRRALGYPTARL
jgi:2-methylisocitrate lyase-like PEP mutase family enzyme